MEEEREIKINGVAVSWNGKTLETKDKNSVSLGETKIKEKEKNEQVEKEQDGLIV